MQQIMNEFCECFNKDLPHKTTMLDWRNVHMLLTVLKCSKLTAVNSIKPFPIKSIHNQAVKLK